MHKQIDLQTHKVQIADRFMVRSKVMVRFGARTGGWVKIIDLSGRVITVLKINKKSLTVALRSGSKVSVFNIVTKARFKVMPILANKVQNL